MRREAAFLGALAAAGAVGLLAARGQEAPPGAGRDAVHAAIERAAPSIVRLEVRGQRPRGDAARSRLFRDVEGRDAGAAIVVGERLLLTHAALIAYEDATCTVTTGAGKRLGAALRVRDAARELALLETDGPLEVPPLPLGESGRLRVGSLVLALGDPFGTARDARPAASLGVLEARLRVRSSVVSFRGAALVTDAALNPGSEGGPLLDLEGRVVGVLAPLARDERSGSFVAYAIPVEVARELIDGGAAPPKLGLKALPNPDGLRVVEVDPEGRAARAGLRSGDVVLRVGREPATSAALRAAAGAVALTVRRGEAELELVIPDAGAAKAEPAAEPALPGWDRTLSRVWPRAAAAGARGLVQLRPAKGGEARSGVVVAPGLVATSATNLGPLGPGPLVVEGQDGKSLPATVRGRDLRLRLAVLEVPGLAAEPLQPAPPPVPGTHCLVLGSVLDRAGTATSGIVSAVGRFEGRAFQLDAPLDPSNYGGAVLDLEGRLIGIPVEVDPRLGVRSGVGFAIEARRIAAVLEPLARGEELSPGWIGLVVPRLGVAGAGVLVRGVTPGGPAEQAGIEPGERVVRLNGVPTPDRRAFREALADLWAGQEVVVELTGGRAGARRVTLTAAHKR